MTQLRPLSKTLRLVDMLRGTQAHKTRPEIFSMIQDDAILRNEIPSMRRLKLILNRAVDLKYVSASVHSNEKKGTFQRIRFHYAALPLTPQWARMAEKRRAIEAAAAEQSGDESKTR